MSSSKKLLINRAFIISDVLMFTLAQLCALLVFAEDIDGDNFLNLLAMRLSILNAFTILSFIVYWVLLLRAFNVNERIDWDHKPWHHIGWILLATTVNLILFVIADYFLNISIFTSWYILLSGVFLFSFTVFGRAVLSAALNVLHIGDQNTRRMIILGTGVHAKKYASEIIKDREATQLIGFMNMQEAVGDKRRCFVPVEEITCSIKSFEQYYLNNVIDDLVICLHYDEYTEEVIEFISFVADLGISLHWPLPDFLPFSSKNASVNYRVESFKSRSGKSEKQIVLSTGPVLNWNYIAKRILDLSLSLFILMLVMPVLALAVLAIKITSPGNVLFIQKRYGYNGRVIDVYKLRTMVSGAEKLQDKLRDTSNEMDGAVFKMTKDPRVTAVGRFLRKSSIDELPQLVNVLKGDMSIVGPRPLPLEDYKRLKEIKHRRRLSVLPGITGSWQVSGRNNISFEEWMQLDIDYIENWSLKTDLKLIFMTVPAVLFGRGAS